MDTLAAFKTAAQTCPTAPARYAIRQALDQEYQKYLIRQSADAGQARYKSGGQNKVSEDSGLPGIEPFYDRCEANNSKPSAAKYDFFGRTIEDASQPSRDSSWQGKGVERQASKPKKNQHDKQVWVSFHEGFSNAVRKPITLIDLMEGF